MSRPGADPLGYKSARAALGITQSQAARALGCTFATIKRIERGVVPYPSYTRLLYDLLLGFETVEALRLDAVEGQVA